MRIFIFTLFLFFTLNGFGQFSLTGTVSNEKGELLEFATVFFENTTYAASTDKKGSFAITNIKPGTYSLKITFVGYQSFQQEILINTDLKKDIVLPGTIFNLNTVEILANRVAQDHPFTKQNLDSKTLNKENLGQDAPFLLQWTPSMVVTSDAGAGIGYTGLRLRGSDQTRINVTLNGVPINDAESQNVFWVNMPDLMTSVSNLQIQRGVGPSTNGSGAFGGTVSMNTSEVRVNPFLDIASTLGSFNTRKVSLKLGSGLMNNKYLVEGRYSIIKSDGYIDRASSDLNSMYFSAAKISERSSLRFNVIHGKEITYQSWYGAPEAKVTGDIQALQNHYLNNLGSIYKTHEDSVNLFSSDRRYNYYTYPNQVDNYRQTHCQLLYDYAPNATWKTKTTLFYTKGRGYFQEFRHDAKWSDYNIEPEVQADGSILSRSNIVRRRWLDNDLVGLIVDAQKQWNKNLTFHAGLAANVYLGDHFGNVISSSVGMKNLDREKRYYDNKGRKSDLSSYFRSIYNVADKITLYGDVQVRKVNYEVEGIDNDLRSIDVKDDFLFINPKFGLNYDLASGQNMYFSFAKASKEPSRGDFIDNAFGILPSPEILYNWELGYQGQWNSLVLESNIYYMDYNNQLVLTGELNDVGANIRINVPKSFRLGWENNIVKQWSEKWATNVTATWSINKIEAFDEILADYTDGFEIIKIPHQNTDISFSPSLTAAFQLMFTPVKSLHIEWSAKYVSQQYLDNTSNTHRSLPAYSFQNLRVAKQFKSKFWKHMECNLMINNIWNQLYSTNGYSYSYVFGSEITENFLYPQAGRNFMLGVHFGF